MHRRSFDALATADRRNLALRVPPTRAGLHGGAARVVVRVGRAVAALLAIATAACAGSCACEPAVLSPTTSAGGASAASGTGGDAGVDEPDARPDADAGEGQGGGLTWSPVPWPAPCLIEVASDPKLAQAPLTWEACPGIDGCEQVVVNWPRGKLNTAPMVGPSVLRIGDTYRVGALISLEDYEARAVVYDTDGTAMAVWRVVECSPSIPRVYASGFWFGAQWAPNPSTYFFAPYNGTGQPKAVNPTTLMSQGVNSSEDLFAIQLTNGLTINIYDRLKNTTSTFGPPVGLGNEAMWPSGDAVFFLHYPEFEKPEGWVWRRATNTFDPLLQPAPELIVDLKSDGATLVWVRTPPKPVGGGTWPQGDLWTSPYATTTAGLVPTKRRQAAVVFDAVDVSYANAGYYAVYANDYRVHIYRLEDARHWSFAPPPDSWNLWQIAYVDEKDVWYQTLKGVYRQSLASLGPGD